MMFLYYSKKTNFMHRIIFTLLCVFQVFVLFAGGIKGYIRNPEGEALPYASIYIDELGSGTAANEEGYYEYRMLPGEYRVVYQYLGYETQVERITVGANMRELNITLQEQTFELEQIEIIDNGEDPAYTVMRRAIAKAKYHRQQVDAYTAKVYIKGSGRLLNTPGLFRKALENEGVEADSTTAFTSESVSVLEYERPNTYRERVISVYTQGDNNGADPNGFIYGSFYEADIGGAVSPLSPRAFAHYRFELEGYFSDRGQSINKIKVTPRRKGDDVFSGYIYIVENLWNIHSLSLEMYKLGFHFDVNQVYAPIEEDIWLPISHKFKIDGKVFGFGFDYNYLATLSEYDVTINPELATEFTVLDDKLGQEVSAEDTPAAAPAPGSVEEKLITGEELTAKDLRRLMREYERQEREEQPEPEVVSNYSQEIDSLARQRDTAYWSVVRPVPLTDVEVRGYEVQDSMAKAEIQAAEDRADNVRYTSSKKKNRQGFPVGSIFFGTYKRLGEGRVLHYDGINNGGFNPVEGYWLTSGLRYTQRSGDRRFQWLAEPRYGFSWKKFRLRSELAWRLDGEQERSYVRLDGGQCVAQYNEDTPVNQAFNTFYALFFERNFVRLYDKKYGRIRWNKNWSKTAAVNIGFEYAQRDQLLNTTNQTFFDREDRIYAPNRPDILEAIVLNPPLTENAATFNLSLWIRPWQKYSIRNGERESVEGSSPRFGLHYRQGIPLGTVAETDYQRLGLAYRHTIRSGAGNKLDLKFDLGMFLSDNVVGLADYQHFRGNRMIFTTADPVGAYRLLPYYTYSTADRWLSGHAHYQFRRFLLTRLSKVQMTGARENLFANYLNTPTSEHYTEVGYSLDNIFRFLRLEGVVAFRDGKYHDWGIRIGVASNILGSFGTVELADDNDGF